jgi:RNA polymerase sigma-70 factor, ECF subfamily
MAGKEERALRSLPTNRGLERPRVSSSALLATEPDTGSLVARAQAGDLRAFEALYRRHQGRVFGVCLRMARSTQEAEEWAQDAWIRAWERLESFRGDSAFTTWLHRLTVNVVLDRRRSDGRREARFTSVDSYAPVDRGDPSVAPGGLGTDLERAIGTLPEGARTVFLLYDVEGFKHQEIAEQLGVAEGTVKAQLHRARKMLREALER